MSDRWKWFLYLTSKARVVLSIVAGGKDCCYAAARCWPLQKAAVTRVSPLVSAMQLKASQHPCQFSLLLLSSDWHIYPTAASNYCQLRTRDLTATLQNYWIPYCTGRYRHIASTPFASMVQHKHLATRSLIRKIKANVNCTALRTGLNMSPRLLPHQQTNVACVRYNHFNNLLSQHFTLLLTICD